MNCRKCPSFYEVDQDYAQFRQCRHGCGANQCIGYISFGVDVENGQEFCPLLDEEKK